MKRTKWIIAVRQTWLTTIYRRVMQDGDRYFIKCDGKVYDVTHREDRFLQSKTTQGVRC